MIAFTVTLNDKTFEVENFYGLLGHNVGKTFMALLNQNESNFRVLKICKTYENFFIKSFAIYGIIGSSLTFNCTHFNIIVRTAGNYLYTTIKLLLLDMIGKLA